jgi:hypothetical protein
MILFAVIYDLDELAQVMPDLNGRQKYSSTVTSTRERICELMLTSAQS